MKTNLIRTAAATVALVIAISVSGQNTKSFRKNLLSNKFKMVKENINILANELKSAAQFKPEANLSNDEATVETLIFDLKGLETDAKFNPASALTESATGYNDMNNTLEDLKSVVKYQPQTEDLNNTVDVQDIMNQLAAVVRYTPES
jgi:hypothetical protein